MFKAEITPVTITEKKGKQTIIDFDEECTKVDIFVYKKREENPLSIAVSVIERAILLCGCILILTVFCSLIQENLSHYPLCLKVMALLQLVMLHQSVMGQLLFY